MEFTEAELLDFIAVYKREYGVALTPEEAEDEFSRLVELFRLVYKCYIPQLERLKVAAHQDIHS